MKVGELLNLYGNHESITIIKNSRRIVAKTHTFSVYNNKYLCAEYVKSFDFKDGEFIIEIYGEERDECDNCNRPCCYGCPHAE